MRLEGVEGTEGVCWDSDQRLSRNVFFLSFDKGVDGVGPCDCCKRVSGRASDEELRATLNSKSSSQFSAGSMNK